MKPQRLKDLEDLLELLYEKEAELAAAPTIRFEVKQRLKREIVPKIQQYETEYGEIVAASDVTIDETQAEIIVVELDDAVTAIEQRPPTEVPPELLAEIAKLHEKLDALDPTVAAAAKLKVVLPIVPTMISYELEMDTEGTLKRIGDKIQNVRNRLFR